ncbi:DNA helicase INO80 [Ceratobasidium theobromae]|uniref:DNA helicase INO80 n=1 Tax=Ceratobasidium theobromae TaxID=1582974 RepID=A0A5N5Q8N8_9AGAM|nr:DNA helicase INO80 [Ceratobasidium theobromae]
MAPRPRVKCACKCGQLVTTEIEGKHLLQKYYTKTLLVPAKLQRQRSKRDAAPPAPGMSLSTPPEQYATGSTSDLHHDTTSPNPPDINDVPDSGDHELLWAQVLRSRVQIQEEDVGSSELSAATGFVSQTDSDASAEPNDPPEGQFNPATYGISPGELLRKERIVQSVLDAQSIAIEKGFYLSYFSL